MPPTRLVLLALAVSPALAHADARFGAAFGVDTGHGDGSALHRGIFVRFGVTPRLGIELELERISPRDDDRGEAVTALGGGLVYRITTGRSVTPFVRAGAGIEPGDSDCTDHQRLDAGLGAERVLDERLFIAAELRFTRRWADGVCGIPDGDYLRGAIARRGPDDPWDDLTFRLSLGVGF